MSQHKDDAGSTPAEPDTRWHDAMQQILRGNWVVGLGAVILAVIAGSILVCCTNDGVQEAAKYFFARPMDTISAIGAAIGGAYSALFQGAIYNFDADSFSQGIRPLTETLNFATPLIAAGLGVAVAFRAGMFNIGGQGQMLMGAAAAGWIGFSVHLPWPWHMLLAMVVGICAGALWAGIAGLLKAKTGAHEVIVTIMLNWIAFYLISYLLSTPSLLQAPNAGGNPKSPATEKSAIMPPLLGSSYNLNLGFVFSLIAVLVVWWLLNRSTSGFRLRGVGENSHAARVAGMDVSKVTVAAMLIAGGLIGLAATTQVLGSVTTGFSNDVDAGIGFDAITVALLGGSGPWGVLAAAILFGAFKAGGSAMQVNQGIPIDIVQVVQSLIVLFIAAPPLVRAIFHLPQPSGRGSRGGRRRAGGPAPSPAGPARQVPA